MDPAELPVVLPVFLIFVLDGPSQIFFLNMQKNLYVAIKTKRYEFDALKT